MDAPIRTPSAADDTALVVDLAELSADSVAAVGGKAANLGELIRAGFDVPPGFCITTEAYRRAVRGTSVEDGTLTDAAPEVEVSEPRRSPSTTHRHEAKPDDRASPDSAVRNPRKGK